MFISSVNSSAVQARSIAASSRSSNCCNVSPGLRCSIARQVSSSLAMAAHLIGSSAPRVICPPWSINAAMFASKGRAVAPDGDVTRLDAVPRRARLRGAMATVRRSGRSDARRCARARCAETLPGPGRSVSRCQSSCRTRQHVPTRALKKFCHSLEKDDIDGREAVYGSTVVEFSISVCAPALESLRRCNSACPRVCVIGTFRSPIDRKSTPLTRRCLLAHLSFPCLCFAAC